MDGDCLTHENCDAANYKELAGAISSTAAADQTVAPFLAKHIPQQYAPLAPDQRDLSTKFCYRHRPDIKCRRTADEPSMEILQRVC